MKTMSEEISSCNHKDHDKNSYCVSIVPIFNHLEAAELKEIVSTARSVSHPRGQMIYRPGEPSEGIYIVHKGSMRIFRESSGGKEQLVRILGPGEFSGELALFNESVHDAYAEALEPLEICMISRESLQAFLLKYPQIALKMLAEFSSRLATSEEQAARIAMETVETRIAMYLAGQVEAWKNARIKLPMRRKDLASHLGTTPETISRKLADFEAAGWIRQTGQRDIEVIDLEALLLV